MDMPYHTCVEHLGSLYDTNIPSYQDGKSHCKDKMIRYAFYLHNGISYTGKTATIHWNGPKMGLIFWKSHCGDKMILWSSYLHNGIFILVAQHLCIETSPKQDLPLWCADVLFRAAWRLMDQSWGNTSYCGLGLSWASVLTLFSIDE